MQRESYRRFYFIMVIIIFVITDWMTDWMAQVLWQPRLHPNMLVHKQHTTFILHTHPVASPRRLVHERDS